MKKSVFTEKQDAVIAEMAAAGATDRQIADVLGCSITTLYNYRRDMGIERSGKRRRASPLTIISREPMRVVKALNAEIASTECQVAALRTRLRDMRKLARKLESAA